MTVSDRVVFKDLQTHHPSFPEKTRKLFYSVQLIQSARSKNNFMTYCIMINFDLLDEFPIGIMKGLGLLSLVSKRLKGWEAEIKREKYATGKEQILTSASVNSSSSICQQQSFICSFSFSGVEEWCPGSFEPPSPLGIISVFEEGASIWKTSWSIKQQGHPEVIRSWLKSRTVLSL